MRRNRLRLWSKSRPQTKLGSYQSSDVVKSAEPSIALAVVKIAAVRCKRHGTARASRAEPSITALTALASTRRDAVPGRSASTPMEHATRFGSQDVFSATVHTAAEIAIEPLLSCSMKPNCRRRTSFALSSSVSQPPSAALSPQQRLILHFHETAKASKKTTQLQSRIYWFPEDRNVLPR